MFGLVPLLVLVMYAGCLRLLFRVRPRAVPAGYCLGCGYQRLGAVHCPECGATEDDPRTVWRSPRARAITWPAATLLALGGIGVGLRLALGVPRGLDGVAGASGLIGPVVLSGLLIAGAFRLSAPSYVRWAWRWSVLGGGGAVVSLATIEHPAAAGFPIPDLGGLVAVGLVVIGWAIIILVAAIDMAISVRRGPKVRMSDEAP